LITHGVIQSQQLCLSPFLSRKVRTISNLPFALVVVVTIDLVIIVAVVAVAVVVVVVVLPQICHTHPNTVTGRRPSFRKSEFLWRGMISAKLTIACSHQYSKICCKKNQKSQKN
jgi:ABC-type enterochelin transport system permease subunit